MKNKIITICLVSLFFLMTDSAIADLTVSDVYFSAEAEAELTLDGSHAWDSMYGYPPIGAWAELEATYQSHKMESALGDSSVAIFEMNAMSAAQAENFYDEVEVGGWGYAQAYAEYEINSSFYWSLDVQFIREIVSESNYGYTYAMLNMEAWVYEYESPMQRTLIEYFQRYSEGHGIVEYSDETETATFDPGLYELYLFVASESEASVDGPVEFFPYSSCYSKGSFSVDVTQVPTPSAFILGALGLGFSVMKLRRRRTL